MNLRRFLHPEGIRLELQTKALPEGADADDFDAGTELNLARIRRSVFAELVELFEISGCMANQKRLLREFEEREKKTSCALGQGIAVPHLRTLQLKRFILVFGRSSQGIPFGAPDEEPVHLFFGMAAPPYDDRTYLKVYKALAKVLMDPVNSEGFMNAQEPSEILRLLEVVC